MSKPARRQYTSHAASPHKSIQIQRLHTSHTWADAQLFVGRLVWMSAFGWIYPNSRRTSGAKLLKFCLNDIDFIRFPKLERRQTGPCWGWCSQLSSSCCAVWEPLQVSDFRHSRLQRWQFARCSALNCPWPGHALLNPATHVWSATDTKPMNFKASWFGSHR